MHSQQVRCEEPAGHDGPHFNSFNNDAACPFEAATRDECAMVRERSVAGVSDDIPACPVHGEWKDAVDALDARQ